MLKNVTVILKTGETTNKIDICYMKPYIPVIIPLLIPQ